MSLLDIHVLGAPILRRETTIVTAVSNDLRRLADDMFETMHAAKGIGLAAPQVGREERLAVVDVDDNPLILINPEIIRREGTIKGEEGCLSIPEIFGQVERAEHVTVRAMDLEGRLFEVDGDELFGRCMQHEIDHLHGRLFLDHLSLLRRRSALAKWEREKKHYPSNLRVLATELAEHHNDEAL